MKIYSLLGILLMSSLTSAQAAPTAAFSASPNSGSSPLTVVLDGNASSDDSGAVVNTFNWTINGISALLDTNTEQFEVVEANVDMADGNMIVRNTMRVKFKQDGEYRIGLTVTNAQGIASAETVQTLKLGSFTNHYTLLFSTSGDDYTTVSNSRATLQKMYALEMGNQIIKKLDAYRKNHQAPMPDADFQAHVATLLNNNQDMLVQSIEYVQGQSFSVKLQDSSFVEERLRSTVFPFKFADDIQKWVVDIGEYPLGALFDDYKNTKEITTAMNFISYFCKAGQDLRDLIPTSNKLPLLLGDKPAEVWCPIWHNNVWPPVDQWVMNTDTVIDLMIGPIPRPERISTIMDVVSSYCQETERHFIPTPAIENFPLIPPDGWCGAWHDLIWPVP